MNRPGLQLIFPELTTELSQISADERQTLVRSACEAAIRRTGMAHPTLNEALTAIRLRTSDDLVLRSKLDKLVQDLDEVAWAVQDRVEVGDAGQEEYESAFRKARSVAAIGFALDTSLSGSLDALYEANHAIGDRSEFLRAIGR